MNEFIEQTIYRMNEFTKQSLSKNTNEIDGT